MQVDHPVLSNLPQPQPKRHGRSLDVVGKPLRRLDQHVLHDVARINPRRHPPVHPGLHHPPDRIPVAPQQLSQSRLISPGSILEQVRRRFRVRLHGVSAEGMRQIKSVSVYSRKPRFPGPVSRAIPHRALLLRPECTAEPPTAFQDDPPPLASLFLASPGGRLSSA